TDPEMFREIQARVAEGRWNLVGGWYLQPDCNMPAGESFARHALISQRYFKEKFGVTARTGYNVDSFGHNASLPKLLQGAGMSRYVFMRPMEHEKHLDFDHFLWKSDDGSEVVTSRIRQYYGPPDEMASIAAIDRVCAEDGIPRMAFYGIGNHGGGPSARLLDTLSTNMQAHQTFASVDDFFDALDTANLPTHTTELQHHARGCYSAVSAVKRANRAAEENLLTAERLCLLANRLVGVPYPKTELRKAWENVLFNQFHDILAGCCIESAYKDAMYLYGEAMAITERAINKAMQAVAMHVETARGHDPGELCNKHFLTWEHKDLGTPVLVFNPHAFPVKALLHRRADCKSMTDEQGKEIPCQQVRGEATNCTHDLYETAFIAELPAYGYRLYRYFPTKEQTTAFPCVKAEQYALENECIRAEFDPGSGELCRLTDKKSGRVICNRPTGAVLLDESECDTWAHNRFDLGPLCGRFEEPRFEILEQGAVCAVLRTTHRCGENTLARTYTLAAGSDQLQVTVEARVCEPHRALKLTFPAENEVTCEIPFGTITRPLCNGEEPFGKWFASAGLGIANEGKYGYDSTQTEIRMTVLRTAVYADHYGVRDGRYHYMDMDTHTAQYIVFPYTTTSDAHKRAAVLNAPLRSVNASFHHGNLPESFCGIEGSENSLLISAIKQGEDGKNFVLRCWESEGKQVNGTVTLLGKQIQVALSPYSVSTVNEDGKKLDFMEWEK
ncbi:MAG: hypothetical protein IJW70_12215, partial [Clostridia bacterium]|nr:hypothetical protein [Clostridia bacterium]